MSSRLRAITIEKFKSIFEETRVELGALTVFVGKNNSGKSTITQALLLLKQTLELTRVDTTLHLDGYVTASNLRELVSGWPEEEAGRVDGPKFSIEWSSHVDVKSAFRDAGNPDLEVMVDRTKLPWLKEIAEKKVEFFNRMDLSYAELKGKVILERVDLLCSLEPRFVQGSARFRVNRNEDGQYECVWSGQTRKKMDVDLHHFIPSISIDKRNVGPRDSQRALTSVFNVLFARPLDELEVLLKGFSYLSSTRSLPPAFYSAATTGGGDIGVSGEFAAQLLYAHRDDLVHYLLPNFTDTNASPTFREKPLAEAINEVLNGLGIETPLSIHEIERVGFRLLFGKATLSHVGRGLTYLLPIVQLGLFSDPKRFEPLNESDNGYEGAPTRLCAFEEPESHLHPKVQARLATWFLALAQASRQVIVETHSDHLVRRLRGILANATLGSSFEAWLLEHIRVVSVNQVDGRTKIESSRINRDGGMEIWPPDFMDAATSAEEEIYYSALEKADAMDSVAIDAEKFHHEHEDEPSAGS